MEGWAEGPGRQQSHARDLALQDAPVHVWSSLLIRLTVEGPALIQRGHAPGRGCGSLAGGSHSPGALLEDVFGWVLPQPLPALEHHVFRYFW